MFPRPTFERLRPAAHEWLCIRSGVGLAVRVEYRYLPCIRMVRGTGAHLPKLELVYRNLFVQSSTHCLKAEVCNGYRIRPKTTKPRWKGRAGWANGWLSITEIGPSSFCR
ncbi:hypothetical protein PoB_001226100 [Plakobranchus ocellatus]|uniref:Uncharacterized protein n=1 Tax=Plakobranchus ocellatus TaxID=259542 RepID=A0AAV3YR04_9GAST|nr:hypothetical protein PoB_001226100 [Plakobranchus ocellatus]